MEKTAVLSDLPHGSGAALGAFIRSLFLTASNKYSIIGIGVNGQGAFDKIGNNTTLVTDVVLLFTSERYIISEKITEMARMCGSSSLGDVYELSISLNNASEIKTSDCVSFYTTQSERKITLTEPTPITLTFYICKVTGLISEARSSAALADVLADDEIAKVIPTTAFGERNSNCWSTLDEHKFTENLTLHFSNESEDELDADLRYLSELYKEYVIEGIELINQL